MNAHKRRVLSATYFLVWHCGMSIADAEDAIIADRSCIVPLARAGSYAFRRSISGLLGMLEANDAALAQPTRGEEA